MSEWILLAQTSAPAGPPANAPGGASAAPGDMTGPFLALMLAIVVFYVFLFRGQKKERQKHEQMLNSLKKNDRVLTIGGLYGTVVEARDQDVVVKVDENNNVKVRFHRSAIKEVVRGEEGK